MKKYILKILLLVCIFTISQLSFGYVNIYPMKFDKNIDGNEGYETYYLYNPTEKTVRYRIYTDKVEDDINDMSKWIEVYPKSITLKPNEEKEIKIQAKAPSETKSGEYTAVLGIKEIPLPETKDSNNVLDIFTDLRLEIIGFVGDLKPKLSTKNIEVTINKKGEIITEGIVQNRGTRRGIFEFFFVNSKGKEKCLAGEVRLLTNRETDIRNINIKIEDEYMKKDIFKYDTFVIKEKGRSDRNIESFKIGK